MRGPLLLCIMLLAGAFTRLQAQTDLSVFSTTGRAAATTFVTDYQAIGINPANLAQGGRWPQKKLSLGLLEVSLSAYSEALSKTELRESIRGGGEGFTHEQQVDAAKEIANKNLILNADVMSIGAAYRTDGMGGLGFLVRDRAQWSSILGPLASELLFEGSSASYFDQLVLANGDTIPNSGDVPQTLLDHVVEGIRNGDPLSIATVIKGTDISFQWYREYNLSYGRRILHAEGLDLFAGIGLKYLSGYGVVAISAKNDGSFTAFSALSPAFDIDYGVAAASSNTVSDNGSALPRAVGHGTGMDLGLSAIVGEKWKFGASVTNIGSITWKGNAYTANDGYLTAMTSSGLDSYNIFDGLDELTSSEGVLEWQGEHSRKVALPTNARIGAGVLVGKVAELGADVVLPVNDKPGNYAKAVIGLGGDIRPVKWLQLSAGFVTGGGYDTKIPLGIAFNVGQGTWEFGAASRDAVTFFAQNKPTISLSFGFLRFRF